MQPGRESAQMAPPGVHEILRSPGQPLSQPYRGDFEAHLGTDLSGVRVHTDPRAGASADDIGARAYTVGRNLVFSRGAYTPHTTEGRRLLAHELAHAVQQQGAMSIPSRLEIGDVDDPVEREAELFAKHAASAPVPAKAPVAGAHTKPSVAPLSLRRQPLPTAQGNAGQTSGASGPQTAPTQSCAGWESDPQSFSIRIAKNFAKDVFNHSLSTPDSVKGAGTRWVVHYETWPVVDITVDLSQVPGVVAASGKADLAMRSQSCTYHYSCYESGAIAFQRISCKYL
jgi:hypothetical protein